MKPIRLVKGFLTVGVWTLASRILGLARDIMLGAYLGTGPVAEAFLMAFSLPNLFRRFFAEGAFNTAFVPLFAKRLETDDAPARFAREAFSGLASVLILVTLIAMLGMPWLVLAIASGFAGDARFDMTVVFGRIAFPYILFISLAALLSGVLNATGRFAAAAAAPVLLNICFIAAMLGGSAMGWDMGLVLAWTVPVAGVAQFALVWGAAARAGFPLIPQRPVWSPEMKHLAILALPALLANGVVQVNLLVGRQVASYTEGAVAWLYYADRIYQLPLGMVGIAIGIVLLPDLSRRLRAGDDDGGRNSFNRATEFALALTVPSAVALVVIALPIISVLFGRGAFGPDDVARTALALAVYGLGLPAFVLQKTLQPLYYAREDTRSPFRFAVLAMVVNAVVAIGLMPFIGFVAAALATTFAAWVMVAQLWWGSRAMGLAARADDRLRRRFWRIVAASIVMGAVLWLAHVMLVTALALPTWRYLALAVLVAVGAIAYFGTGFAIGAFHRTDFRSALRRGG